MSLPPARWVLATANAHKAAELARLFDGFGVTLVPRPPAVTLPVETGRTFLANARLKARAVAAATGEVALADDSGLEVDALGGEPGVFSARYAGEGADDALNNAKLLAELAGIHGPNRRARNNTHGPPRFAPGIASCIALSRMFAGRLARFGGTVPAAANPCFSFR